LDAFNNNGTDLVVQFSLHLIREVGCGGNTIKIMPEGFEQETLNGSTPYLINFGVDICGENEKIQIGK